VSFFQIVWSVLHETRHDVLPGRCNRGIRKAWNHDINIRMSREPAILRLIVGALHIFDGWRDRNRPTQMRPCPWKTFEIRQGIEREIHFSGRAAKFISLHIIDKIRRKVFSAGHLDERQPRIDTRGNDIRSDLIAVFEYDSSGLATLDDD